MSSSETTKSEKRFRNSPKQTSSDGTPLGFFRSLIRIRNLERVLLIILLSVFVFNFGSRWLFTNHEKSFFAARYSDRRLRSVIDSVDGTDDGEFMEAAEEDRRWRARETEALFIGGGESGMLDDRFEEEERPQKHKPKKKKQKTPKPKHKPLEKLRRQQGDRDETPTGTDFQGADLERSLEAEVDESQDTIVDRSEIVAAARPLNSSEVNLQLEEVQEGEVEREYLPETVILGGKVDWVSGEKGGVDALGRRAEALLKGMTPKEKRFWAQPASLSLLPCLRPSPSFSSRSSASLSSGLYISAVVTGGLNQMRIQIGNAVVIARILGAALVVPVLQKNSVWKDDSEFSDLFDVAHFKSSLRADLHIVTTLPPHYLRTHAELWMPLPHAKPSWFLSNLRKPLRRDHVLTLRGLDQALSPDLPKDLQKLRCKVEFHALRFSPPIASLGLALAQRMAAQGPFLALHLRLEPDVWVRTGCRPFVPGIDPNDEEKQLSKLRRKHPNWLTGQAKMSFGGGNATSAEAAEARRVAGLCPMTADMVATLLSSLGAAGPSTRIFWAGGEPFGGEAALNPLRDKFPQLFTKTSLAKPGELDPFLPYANMLAALDFLVCLHADVFMPSHGGNMAHVLQGHRAFRGHKKFIMPQKRAMIGFYMNSTVSSPEFPRAMQETHEQYLGQPRTRVDHRKRDVIAYPVPECMCKYVGLRDKMEANAPFLPVPPRPM